MSREARAAVITARDSAASDTSVYRAQNNHSHLKTHTLSYTPLQESAAALPYGTVNLSNEYI